MDCLQVLGTHVDKVLTDHVPQFMYLDNPNPLRSSIRLFDLAVYLIDTPTTTHDFQSPISSYVYVITLPPRGLACRHRLSFATNVLSYVQLRVMQFPWSFKCQPLQIDGERAVGEHYS